MNTAVPLIVIIENKKKQLDIDLEDFPGYDYISTSGKLTAAEEDVAAGYIDLGMSVASLLIILSVLCLSSDREKSL